MGPNRSSMSGIPWAGARPSKRSVPKGTKWLVVLLASAVIGLLGFRAYNASRFHVGRQTRFLMNTHVTIQAVGPERVVGPAIAAAMDRMAAVADRFDIHHPESPIHAFNERGVPITDPEILSVAALALEIGRRTGGAFDITVSPLVDLWGFYGETPALPDGEAVRKRLELVGARHLNLSEGRLTKTRPGVRIDLGGIAKGHTIAQGVRTLAEKGVRQALIDAGGDVYAMGGKGKGRWEVGLKNPRGEDLLGSVEIADLAVMGSGDYERGFTHEGRRYHHILNPKTGYPARGLSGATLFFPEPTAADAWCTALFVLGPEQGMWVVERIDGMEAILVTESGERLLSSGLDKMLKPIPTSE